MKDKILKILAQICEDDVVKEEPDLDLFEEGLLDSMGVAQLLMEAEDDLGVVIALTEIQRSDIDTPAKIVRLISERAEQ